VTIRVHIERLVLDGLPFDHRQGAQVRAAVERHLARRLTEGAGAASLGGSRALAALDAGSIEVPATPDPTAVGAGIAGAVHGGLGASR
jgi:hypothetical protein